MVNNLVACYARQNANRDIKKSQQNHSPWHEPTLRAAASKAMHADVSVSVHVSVAMRDDDPGTG